MHYLFYTRHFTTSIFRLSDGGIKLNRLNKLVLNVFQKSRYNNSAFTHIFCSIGCKWIWQHVIFYPELSPKTEFVYITNLNYICCPVADVA